MKPPSLTPATTAVSAPSPVGTSMTLAQITAARYGEPRFRNGRGQVVPNLQFWAAMFVARCGLEYSPHRNIFILLDRESQQRRQVDADQIQGLVRTFLSQIAREDRYHYLIPVLAPRRFDKLLSAVKDVAGGTEPDEAESLDAFLAARLERHQASSITTREVLLAYQDYCTKSNLPAMPQKVFFNYLAKRVRAKFSVVRRHDICREGTATNGFMHLRLKA